MTILRWLFRAIVVALVALAIVSFLARWNDGPLAMLAGGPLTAGDWVMAPPDWNRMAAIPEVEFQLLEPSRSRTLWLLSHRGAGYIPCGMPNLWLWKQWPHEALEDGRGVLRVEGKRHPVQAVRVTDPTLFAELHQALVSKYPDASAFPQSQDRLWFFRLDPRPVQPGL